MTKKVSSLFQDENNTQDFLKIIEDGKILRTLPIVSPILIQPPFSSQQLTVDWSFAIKFQGWLSVLPNHSIYLSSDQVSCPNGLFMLGQACEYSVAGNRRKCYFINTKRKLFNHVIFTTENFLRGIYYYQEKKLYLHFLYYSISLERLIVASVILRLLCVFSDSFQVLELMTKK